MQTDQILPFHPVEHLEPGAQHPFGQIGGQEEKVAAGVAYAHVVDFGTDRQRDIPG